MDEEHLSKEEASALVEKLRAEHLDFDTNTDDQDEP